MARKWTGKLLDTLLVPVPPGVQCKGPLNNYYVLCSCVVSFDLQIDMFLCTQVEAKAFKVNM